MIDAYLSPLLGRYLGRLGEAARERGLPEPAGDEVVGRRRARPPRPRARAPGACSRARPAAPSAPALLAGLSGDGRRARLRHGRDVVRRLRGRGRPGAAHRLARDRRPGDPAADGRRPHRRRRRRLDRLARPRRRAARRPAVGRRRARAGLLRARAASSRRSPTPTCCSATSTPDSDAGRRRRARRRRGAAAVARLGSQLGLDPLETAEGIVRVANQEMVRALRVVTVERGVDPRGFALMPFGGAGPMHAAAIADELGDRPDPLPARERRALGARPARLRAPPRHRADGDAERRAS